MTFEDNLTFATWTTRLLRAQQALDIINDDYLLQPLKQHVARATIARIDYLVDMARKSQSFKLRREYLDDANTELALFYESLVWSVIK